MECEEKTTDGREEKTTDGPGGDAKMDAHGDKPDEITEACAVGQALALGIRDDGAMVDCYVGRDPSDARSLSLGKVISYDSVGKVYGVLFEDGHLEDMGHQEVSQILLAEDGCLGMKLSCRKRKLDLLVPSGGYFNAPCTRPRKDSLDGIKPTSDNRSGTFHLYRDADSSSDSCDSSQVTASTSPAAQLGALQLPPSSGDLGIAEESISYLFSVYNFLRSFSHLLFLSPFRLDDFIGALCCKVQNSLLDAIHVSLMRALRRHLEALSSEGSLLASKCSRHCDWPLLDSLTWPAFLVEYLYVMKHMKELAEEGFGIRFLDSHYYGLPEATKLKVLQILCDDILDSAELRAELEMREDMDEEKDSSPTCNFPLESGPRRVHPRYSKTSAWKDEEALNNSVEPGQPDMGCKDTKAGVVVSETASDGNSDECCLCGMDGTLICCDGCPSAYHSRCIGLNKASLPEGSWFCPECKVNKISLTCSRVGRGIRGAEIFGVDPYEQVFLGTCNFLLVLGTSWNGEPFSRYYNQDDIIKVLMVIQSAGEITSMYADICRGISKYWELPLSAVPFGRMETIAGPLLDKEPSNGFVPLSDISDKKVSGVFDNQRKIDVSNESSTVDRVTLGQKDDYIETGVSGFGVSLDQSCSWYSRKYDMLNDGTSGKMTLDVAKEILPVKDEQLAMGNAMLTVQKVSPFMHRKVQMHEGNESLLTEISESNQRSGRSATSGTCLSAKFKFTFREHTYISAFPAKNEAIGTTHDNKCGSHVYCEKSRIGSYRGSYDMCNLKLQGYTNQYIQGDVAASAAANLANLVSEESTVPETRASSNARRTMAADIQLQMKAFSGAVIHFFWPNHEKKLMEVPRERCGWCIACQISSTHKKGCLLNLAASNAIKSFARNSSGLRAMKHDASQLSVIAMHILHMKESLHGLLMGPMLDAEYTKQWHDQLNQVSTCRVLKFLLLELERNIRSVALSGNWVKLVDDETLDFSAASTGMTFSGTNQKRGPGVRRNKRQALASEILSSSSDESWKWWRGGKLSRYVVQKWIIPSSLVKKAARQGGCRRLGGICYPESSELPKRNQQYLWRASVERCRSASQLALQVRHLDSNVRWRDLFRPDETPLDGKGSAVDASVFRNAVVCEKKINQNKTIYALKFPSQKHLPLRVSKNILETEVIAEEHRKFWFSEMHIPLYLIKYYEEKAGIGALQSGKCNRVPRFWKRQLKACQKDIFMYLLHKGDKPSISLCVSCKQDVLQRDSVRCNCCQGNCHKDCVVSSTVGVIDDVEFSFTCKLCYRAQAAPVNVKKNGMISSRPSSQQEGQLATRTESNLQVRCHSPALPVGRVKVRPETSSASGAKSGHRAKSVSYGLIWKRKKGDSSGKDFRLENVILKSKEGIVPSRTPICSLCKRPYRSDLMYIRCEICSNWFHADALQLEEDQIFNLIGFKCHKCRRKSLPQCPYEDPNYMKPDMQPLKQGMRETKEVASGKLPKEAVTPALVSQPKVDNITIMNDDPLLNSLGRVEPILVQMPEDLAQINVSESIFQGQRKLSVRRPQIRPEIDINGSHAAQDAHCSFTANSQCVEKLPVKRNDANHEIYAKELPAFDGPNITFEKVSSPAQVISDFPDPAADGDVVISSLDFEHGCGNIENMEYEPQTYFSFTELLASGDGQPDDLGDVTMDEAENWCLPTGFGYSCTTYKEGPPGSSTGLAEVRLDDPGPCVGLVCQICKQNEHPPDLICEVCGMYIHSHCSPWMESEISYGGTGWRCGCCREWR